MSIIFEKLLAAQAGTKFAKQVPIQTSIKAAELPIDDSITVAHEYTITCNFGNTVRCSPEDVPRMLENVAREIQHEIYKDLYTHVVNLERAVFAGDFDKMKTVVDDIINEIFMTPIHERKAQG